MNFAFFGTDEFSVIILDELKKEGFAPSVIITAPDRPKGRGMKITPPPVKKRITNDESGMKNKIKILQPEKLDDNFYDVLQTTDYELFIVASYGKIIPERFLEIPEHGALNVHPSLLPLYRGPSPIQTQILDDAKKVGVTIMKMDEKMDHGPVLAQKRYGKLKKGFALRGVSRSVTYQNLHDALAHMGGQLLAEVIPKWLAGEIAPKEQNHGRATYTKIIKKEDGLIDLNGDAEINFRKFRAFSPAPGVYFFAEKNNKNIRVKITDADIKDGKFVIKKVVPEGRPKMDYKDFIERTNKS